jgi:hypothetical protein
VVDAALRLQGRVVWDGRIQGALRVWILEGIAHFRWQKKRGEGGDGQLRLHQIAQGFAE